MSHSQPWSRPNPKAIKRRVSCKKILKRKECSLLLVENADRVFKIKPRSLSLDLAPCFVFCWIFESSGKLVSRRQQILFFPTIELGYVAVQRDKEFVCWN
ncbi:hypothetical protein V6N13_021135 [Hibiscus sabdariffa]|uniref:Uncharacterized protein n=1 Tax=Hibiscus sabdariffa TaxID=183260 RepID=A0ABR2EW47_9ROSI